MSPDLPSTLANPASPHTPLPASAGWLEVALPLWLRRWRLLFATLLCAVFGLGLGLMQPVMFVSQASFVVQPLLRPSQSVVSGALPALAGLIGTGGSPVELHVTILRSQVIADRIIDRFELQRGWGLPLRTQAIARLGQRVSFGIGRRDGLVQVTVEDESPQRAAQMANEYIEELRATLRGFALEEARQRRQFYEAQLAIAREALVQAQRKLQTSGFDRAALRAEPRAAAESYGRLQAEIAAAEVRLGAVRRVRAETSAEVQQLMSEIGTQRAQLARMEAPRDEGAGSFVSRVRDLRYAETLADSIARQAEAARVDEAADAIPLQVLDRARVPELPSSPLVLRWVIQGAAIGFGLMALWVLLRHRQAMARLDPAFQERVELIRSVMSRRPR